MKRGTTMNGTNETAVAFFEKKLSDDKRRMMQMQAKIKELEADNMVLKKMIAMMMKDNVFVYRTDEIESYAVPTFVIEENIGGEPIIRIQRTKRG